MAYPTPAEAALPRLLPWMRRVLGRALEMTPAGRAWHSASVGSDGLLDFVAKAIVCTTVCDKAQGIGRGLARERGIPCNRASRWPVWASQSAYFCLLIRVLFLGLKRRRSNHRRGSEEEMLVLSPAIRYES